MNINDIELNKKFWSKVNKTDTCWVWIGSNTMRDHVGCGVFYFKGEKVLAHTISWLLHGNELEEGKSVFRSCRNTSCVNPSHLYLDTFSSFNKEDLSECFWSKVDKKSDDECWNWLGCINSSGYGNMNKNRKTVSSHRISWELHFGDIPKGLQVLHRCDNRRCVNPNHLFLGTNTDNVNDKIQKGRQIRGEQSIVSVLTETIVRHGKELRRSGMSYVDIAKTLDVNKRTIWFAINGYTWKHVV